MIQYRPLGQDQDFMRVFHQVCQELLCAREVDTGHWQAKKGTPMSQTRELTNVVVEIPIAATQGSWASYMKPNLPWAEDHFLERVSGIPHNPPPSHEYWPFNQAANKDHMDGEQFSHTYPERMWPRLAPEPAIQGMGYPPVLKGIRYEYGDLNDAIQLLVEEPATRQCFIPIWFPEDLHAAAREHQRVPCTLGYHAMMRRGRLNLFYPMRSLDWLRYARDDAYMAGRLCQWLLCQCQERSSENSVWHDVSPGMLTMHAVSLHVFEGDLSLIRHTLAKDRKRGNPVTAT